MKSNEEKFRIPKFLHLYSYLVLGIVYCFWRRENYSCVRILEYVHGARFG